MSGHDLSTSDDGDSDSDKAQDSRGTIPQIKLTKVEHNFHFDEVQVEIRGSLQRLSGLNVCMYSAADPLLHTTKSPGAGTFAPSTNRPAAAVDPKAGDRTHTRSI